jgi:poly(3-hydroxybutyrate) depolymerase
MRLRHSPVAAALLALVLALLVLLLLAPPAGKSGAPRARVVGETQVARNVADLKVESTALGRTATVRLITPRGWEARKEGRRWPVLYLLHGCCDVPASWTGNTDVEELSVLRDVLVVTPRPVRSASTATGGTTAPAARRHGRPSTCASSAGCCSGTTAPDGGALVAGLSMGGFGALSYAARHPRMFRAAASYSGFVHPLFSRRRCSRCSAASRRTRRRSGAIRTHSGRSGTPTTPSRWPGACGASRSSCRSATELRARSTRPARGTPSRGSCTT